MSLASNTNLHISLSPTRKCLRFPIVMWWICNNKSCLLEELLNLLLNISWGPRCNVQNWRMDLMDSCAMLCWLCYHGISIKIFTYISNSRPFLPRKRLHSALYIASLSICSHHNGWRCYRTIFYLQDFMWSGNLQMWCGDYSYPTDDGPFVGSDESNCTQLTSGITHCSLDTITVFFEAFW